MLTTAARVWTILGLTVILAGNLLAEEAPTVTLVGYNLRNYLTMDRWVDGEKTEDAPKPEAEIGPLIGYLTEIKPDIIGISEIGDQAQAEDLQSRLKAAGIDLPHLHWLDAADPFRHLAILSRYPIAETNTPAKLTYSIDGTEFEHRRGIIDATVQVTDSYAVRILGVHLKSKRPIREADHDLIRRNEAQLLRDHVDSILNADPTENLVIFGDFNAVKNEPPIGIIRGRSNSKNYMMPIDLEDEDGERWTYYWGTADQYSRFDFLFASRSFVPEILLADSYILADRAWYAASDHRPLVLKFVAEEKE